MQGPPLEQKPHVVIVGAGFGGLSAAQALSNTPFDVTLIDRHNYHLFQPLLYQVATAGLSPADIAAPIRSIVRGRSNQTVMLATVTGIDLKASEVIADDRRVPFDYLILATGAQHAYFGHDDWEPFAPGLKTIDDATRFRARMLLAFERAESETDADERKRLLTFVVIGGGPTGVEMAGAIAELARRALAKDFRTIDPTSARVVLIEAGPRLLSAFDPSLSDCARRSLEGLGVEVRLGQAVTDCDINGVSLGTERIETRTIMWGAGVMASPAGRWLNVPTDRAGRVITNPDLSVPGYSNIFVIGDTAAVNDSSGKPLPGVAPVAKQQGCYVAKSLIAVVHGKAVAVQPFAYRDFGSLATIGRKHAIMQLGRLKLSGFIAWLLWCVAHIYFLIGFRNRLIVALNWMWNYVTFQRGTRLITGIHEARIRPSHPSGNSNRNAA